MILVSSSRELHVSQRLVKEFLWAIRQVIWIVFWAFCSILILVLKICKSTMCKLMSVVKLLPCDHLLFRFIFILSSPASHNGKCLGVVASKRPTRSSLRTKAPSQQFSLACISWAEHGLPGLQAYTHCCKGPIRFQHMLMHTSYLLIWQLLCNKNGYRLAAWPPDILAAHPCMEHWQYRSARQHLPLNLEHGQQVVHSFIWTTV